MTLAPQLVQYQGSKRKLAPKILENMPKSMERLVEPFSGMAAISIAVATEGRAKKYWINDLNAPLISVLKSAVEAPQELYDGYKKIWDAQFTFEEGHVAHFYAIRDRYNSGDRSAAVTLYLLARCVKGAVRYGSNGNFNQSPDKRRHGTNPETLLKTALKLSELLSGKTEFTSMDYRETLPLLNQNDFIYMDPPYQGVTNTRDHRYLAGVEFDSLVQYLGSLNDIGCCYILSYDGSLGDKTYGRQIPESLGCKKLLLNAGQSTQATLLGKKATTFEGLYLSKGLY
jgi:DNA adenine methylase